MVLQRVTSACIATFAQVAALSRASRALSENTPGAEHERRLVQLLCLEVPTSFFLLFVQMLLSESVAYRVFVISGGEREICRYFGLQL